VAGAGEIRVKAGVITGLTNKSGHYQSTVAEMVQVFEELERQGVNLFVVEYHHVGPQGGLFDATPVVSAKQFYEAHRLGALTAQNS
jgi:hypothetical protein